MKVVDAGCSGVGPELDFSQQAIRGRTKVDQLRLNVDVGDARQERPLSSSTRRFGVVTRQPRAVRPQTDADVVVTPTDFFARRSINNRETYAISYMRR